MLVDHLTKIFYVNILPEQKLYISDFGYTNDIDKELLAIIREEMKIISIDPHVNYFALEIQPFYNLDVMMLNNNCKHDFNKEVTLTDIIPTRALFKTNQWECVINSVYKCKTCSFVFIARSTYKLKNDSSESAKGINN